LDMAYKLVQYGGRPVLKLSPGKATLASEKQVFRFSTSGGKLRQDIIGLRDDDIEGSEALLEKVMSKGKANAKQPLLPQIQKRFLEEFFRLDEKYRSLDKTEEEYPVELSPRLEELQSRLVRQLKDGAEGVEGS